MGRFSLIISIILHVIFIIASMTGMPFLKTREFIIPPPPIAVDYIEISQVTETDRIQERRNRVRPSKEDAPPPMPEQQKAPPQPKPAEVNKAEEVKTPPAKPEAKPVAKKDPAPKEVVDENVKPKKDEKPKEVKQASKPDAKTASKASSDFSSVLKNLMEEPEEVFQAPPAINAPLGAKMTISEQDALRGQLERCWNVPFGAKGVEDVLVEIEIVVAPDRTVRSATIVDRSRYSNDNFFRAIADSALRAVRSPLCSPLNLPPDRYDLWKNITVRFNPKDMF